MRAKAYRTGGLYLEAIEGAAVIGTTIHRAGDQHTIRDRLPEPGQFEPAFAILFVDIILGRGERAGIMSTREPAPVDEVGCHESTGVFRRMLLIAPETEVVIGLKRRGGSIVTRLRNRGGELTIESQDKPAGC